MTSAPSLPVTEDPADVIERVRQSSARRERVREHPIDDVRALSRLGWTPGEAKDDQDA